MNCFHKETYVNSFFNYDGSVEHRSFIRRVMIIVFSAIKFLFDRTVAIIGLIITSPLMLVIVVAIKIDSKGPAFFIQKRTGRNGKVINIRKFRTMVANNDIRDFSKPDRHTRVGTFLRKTSLDELPQLLTIASGKMSFIGPRPWVTDYYEKMNDAQRHRYDIRPGLTGLAQVMGRNNLTIFDKINYDLIYIKNYSLSQDIKIVFMTIRTVFTQSGADAGKDAIKRELNDLQEENKHREAEKVI